MHFPILQDLLIIFISSVIVVLIFQRIKIPAIIGFLTTGVIIGPNALSLVKASEEVEVMSEIGVILLLFVIGMELSLKQLAAIRTTVIRGGLMQVGLTILISAVFFKIAAFTWPESIFMGFVFSLSSTAIVLKLLQERNEIASPHGRMALGILIFQDLIVVPMILVTPIMAGNSSNIGMEIFLLLAKSAAVIIITIVSARYLIPRLFDIIVKTRNQELFLLATITLCFAVAFLTAEAGLSLALGAFLAGLIISESPYSHLATGMILPFRELFTSIFFISIGMLLDLSFFLENLPVILAGVLVVSLIKAVVAGTAARILKYSSRTVILTGLSLFQVGEFAFILSTVGIDNGLLSLELYQYFLAISIITMALTPFVLQGSEKIASILLRKQPRTSIPEQKDEDENEPETDHLVIIGFGINGKNVARAARYAAIPYTILELNAETVSKERAQGEHIHYGDAVHLHALHIVNAGNARVIVVAISDPQATKTIVSNIRQLSKSVHIVVRTRFMSEIDELLFIGADEVIPEEFETSIEIFSRVLHQYLIPLDEIEHLTQDIRYDNYQLLAPHHTRPKSNIPDSGELLNIECIRVVADHGPIVNHTVAGAQIRNLFQVNILAISRKKKLISTIGPDEKIRQHDLLYVSGDPRQIEALNKAINF